MSKDEANYRKAENNDECSTCDHFSDNSCDIVSGRISPSYVCDHYDGEPSERDSNDGGGNSD